MMMILAGVLVVAALVLGYLGISIGKSDPSPVNMTEPEEALPPLDVDETPETVAMPPIDASDDIELHQPVVVLARDLPAHHTVQPDDLQVEQLRLMPPGSFSDPDALVGRRVWRALSAGSILTEHSFTAGGPVAQMIRPNERALAVQLEHALGGAGNLAPGDYVDVLLYLPEDAINTDRTVQVAVPALRVLSVGDALGLTLSGEPAVAEGRSGSLSMMPGMGQVETVVLAVPDALLTRFALAAEAGSLRLALRSAAEQRLESYYREEAATEALNQQLFQFEKFALSQATRPQPGLVEGGATRRQAVPEYLNQQTTVPSAVPSSGGVPVIRGATISLETP
ncbi:Flp pilus assembly protein CpaB [Halomonas aquamarina]|uniref:Flp pilus assembly protein CpaB n=2 Tax=Vreelandella aquamarina TaxID=77097 RepID=A0ACC5VTI7_9GAMM|nr:Flp pilus assembly protein CpaB [Halomonas aquamarina]